jgi:hypothetical protein
VPAARLAEVLEPRGFLAGVPMSRFAGAFAGAATRRDLDNVLLLAVTEKRTREQLDAFVAAVAEELSSGEVRDA